MLMRFDPFRELDALDQALATAHCGPRRSVRVMSGPVQKTTASTWRW